MNQTPPGDRRLPIEIRQPTQTKDGISQPIETWTVFARARAAQLNHTGRRFFQAQQMHNETAEVFNIHYLPGITRQMRVVAGGVTYELIDVDDREGRHIEIDLHCKGLV